MMPIMNINQAIKMLRIRKGFSQEKLAELANLDRSFISMMENGQRNPGLQTLDKLAEFLGFRTWEILKAIDEGKCEVLFK